MKQEQKLRLRVERERHGWSQAELARRTGIHPSTVSRLESGKMFAYPGWKARLARALGVAGDALFEEVGSHD